MRPEFALRLPLKSVEPQRTRFANRSPVFPPLIILTLEHPSDYILELFRIACKNMAPQLTTALSVRRVLPLIFLQTS